ncbi:hypothetical protein HS088_TW03G00043 [Tripterygium wilfordii]|uniref:ABC transporter domain-containing protein n=1 Tax=Tripterygium wilfordii TaxID=458696 RepID=A0A7J7DTL7_TRIWF|nr:hypothetical protein HS088_TW03G00043 [Tripterygium wilfordii]
MDSMDGRGDETTTDIEKRMSFTGGLQFCGLIYTVTKKKKLEGKWLNQDVDLLHMITGMTGFCPMLTVYETLMFAADFRLGPISIADKKERVEQLIDQLGLSVRGVSGGERRRVSIGVDMIHEPTLLFLDEPTSGLDSTSAHTVIEKVHNIARSSSTVILTIHQPSSRIQLLLDHLIILARGQLMFRGSPKDVTLHLNRMGRRVPKGENSIEYLTDVRQDYDQSELGVELLAEFARTGVKPPALAEGDQSISMVQQTPPPSSLGCHQKEGSDGKANNGKRLHLQASKDVDSEYDHSVRSPYNNTSKSWSASHSGIVQTLRFTPSRRRNDPKMQNPMSSSPGLYTSSSEILPRTSTAHNSDYSVNEDDYLTPNIDRKAMQLGPKFVDSFFSETWILIWRNFKNIRHITNRLSFFIFTVCLFFFSSNDAVPAFIQERFIFVRETSHNAYRASSYTIAGVITYLPFLGLQASVYAGIVWKALKLRGPFYYFLLVLYVSLLSTNSFVVFLSSVVPNYILGYAAVIAFTALFFLFCGYFLNSHDIPSYWKWMNKISTMSYPYEGLLMNEYQTEEVFGVNADGQSVTGINILNLLHIQTEESKKWEKVLMMLGWAVFYRILFYLMLRFASKNQRS